MQIAVCVKCSLCKPANFRRGGCVGMLLFVVLSQWGVSGSVSHHLCLDTE